MNTIYDVSEMSRLSLEGKNCKEISELLGCSYHTVIYHLNPTRKTKQRSWKKDCYHGKHLLSKMIAFKKGGNTDNFSLKDLKNHIGENPTCFFTGKQIDLSDPSKYSLDHKIPRSKGGSSNLDNLVIVLSEVNKAKHNLLPEEFLTLCKIVSEYNF